MFHHYILISHITKAVRRNPPEVRVTNGQKSSSKIIYIALRSYAQLSAARIGEVIANFCTTVLNNSSKKSFLATPNVVELRMNETLESIGEMKPMMKFCLCLHKFSDL